MTGHKSYPSSWKKLLGNNFPARIKARGKAYFEEKAVDLTNATSTHVSSFVSGTSDYYVELSKDSDNTSPAKVFCDCPYFAKGYPCKHLWATILAADEYISKHEKRKPKPKEKINKDWKELLFPEWEKTNEGPCRWEGIPGEFMLRYELNIVRDNIYIHPIKQKMLKSGQLGKTTSKITYKIFNEPDLPEADRRIFEIILSLEHKRSFNRSWHNSSTVENFGKTYLHSDITGRLLPLLAKTQRCSVIKNNKLIAPTLQEGSTDNVSLEYSLDKKSAHEQSSTLSYCPTVHIEDRSFQIDKLCFMNTYPLSILLESKFYFLSGPDYSWAEKASKSPVINVPKDQAKEIYIHAHNLNNAEELITNKKYNPPQVELPEKTAPALAQHSEPLPILEIDLKADEFQAELFFEYNEFEVAANDPRESLLDVEKWEILDRDLLKEAEAYFSLEDLGISRSNSGLTYDNKSVFEVLDTLFPLAATGWIIRGKDKRTIKNGAQPQLRVKSGIDWFDLDGNVSFGETIIPLPRVVRAFLKGQRIISLADGSIGILPAQWLEKFSPLLSVGDSGKRRKSAIRFHNAHGLLLDSLAEEADIQNSDRNFIEFREKLKTFQEIKATAPPEGLQGSLRSYQHESLCWFDFLKQFGFGGILADDMGLGKTIQVLSWLLLQKERKNKATALVVVPTSLIFNWEAEAERFCPQLKVLNYSGPGRKELETGFSEYDIILTTYGILRLDVEILKETKWDYLILDESQAIKNPDSQTAKAARILDADWKLCMTGTPLENKLDELWSQFNFINPGLLGFRKSFDDRFSKTIALGDEKQKELLQKLIRPFTLRRTKDQVTKDLPPKQESIIFCDMPPAQLKSYNKIRDHYRSEILAEVDQKGLGKSKMKVLEGLLRLRQDACHTALIGEKKSASGKLAELILNVQKIVAEGHKVLVFSQFTKFLKLIREEFESEGIEYEYLDGRTPLKTRKKRVTNFQSPDGPPVFCISLKAGGVGLNLTAADYVFIMDPWWNPAVESQAVDRTHRIGQTKNVFAYRFISTNSIDEKVVKLQDKKRDLAEILASGATSSVSKLTRKDLEELFS